MPPQTLFLGQRWEDSRDNKGKDFLSYLEPSFYGGPIPNWQGLLIRNQLRTNRELIAFNEPELQETGFGTDRPQLLGSRVSPQVPPGIYKSGTRANVFYWKDGFQYSVVYELVPLDSLAPETISNQVVQSIGSSILEGYSDALNSRFARLISLGSSQLLAQLVDLLQQEIEEADIFGVWVRRGTAKQPIDVVVSKAGSDSKGALEGMELNTKKVNPLPYLISGLGIATGSPLVFGAGLLVNYLERRK